MNPRFGIHLAPALLMLAVGCPASPEDGRTRGGGPGADAGNSVSRPVPVPSKITGTKDLRPFRPPS
jgi:hypothetical protein